MKRNPLDFHRANGTRGRQINDIMQKLITNTANQYGRGSREGRRIKQIAADFFSWRCEMEERQFREIPERQQQASCWLGTANDKGGIS